MRWRSWPPIAVNVAGGVDGRPRHSQGVDRSLFALACQAVATPLPLQGGDAVAGVAADGGELAARVDGRARDGEGVDPAVRVRFQAVAAPCVASRAAMSLRVWPPIEVKSPPA